MMAIKIERKLKDSITDCQSIKEDCLNSHFSRKSFLMPSTLLHWIPQLEFVIEFLTVVFKLVIVIFFLTFLGCSLRAGQYLFMVYPCCLSIGRSSMSNYFHNTKLYLPFLFILTSVQSYMMCDDITVLIKWCSAYF